MGLSEPIENRINGLFMGYREIGRRLSGTEGKLLQRIDVVLGEGEWAALQSVAPDGGKRRAAPPRPTR
jgi:hypothetical protein